jgi:histidinol-phosphate aminotransferase
MRDAIYLDKNENHLGASGKAVDAVRAHADRLCRYPAPGGPELKDKIARLLDIRPENVVLGNGSDDILFMVARAYTDADAEIVIPETSFIGFDFAAGLTDARIIRADLSNLTVDLERVREKLSSRTKLIFLANPNNPTGTFVGVERIVGWLETIPRDIIVVIDEAYIEYALEAPNAHVSGMLAAFDNVIVTRTFSKAYGLAGLRVGYGVASSKIIAAISRQAAPFNVNSMALAAAAAALEDQEHLAAAVRDNDGLKDFLYDALSRIEGARVVQTKSNFVCVNFPCDMSKLHASLKEKLIYCSLFTSAEPLTYLRISTGPRHELETVVETLRALLDSGPLRKAA